MVVHFLMLQGVQGCAEITPWQIKLLEGQKISYLIGFALVRGLKDIYLKHCSCPKKNYSYHS